MSNFWFDFRLALRSALRQPGLSAIVVATMAVGIGVNVAIFGYLGYFLWPTIEAPQPEHIFRIYTATTEDPTGSFSYLDWRDLAEDPQVFEETVAFRLFGASVRSEARTSHAWGTAASGQYFELFDARPQLGRLLDARDDRPGADPVIVVSHLFWLRHFEGDPDVVGETVELDSGYRYTVVGVAPEGFQGQGIATSIYLPLAMARPFVSGLDRRETRDLQVLARVGPGVGAPRAASRLEALAHALDEAYPEPEARRFIADPVTSAHPEMAGDPLLASAKMLTVAVALLLLLACANVANLMLARAVARRREMGIHAALGAGSGRLAFRLVVESLMLCVVGGLAGLALVEPITRWIESFLLRTVPVGMGDWAEGTSLVADGSTMAWLFAGLCLGSGLLAGVAPIFHALRFDLVSALKSDVAGDLPGRRVQARHLLVVAQVALSVVLLWGAGLLLRTLHVSGDVDFGFEPRGLSLVSLYTPEDHLGDNAEGMARFSNLLEDVRAQPGVEAASLAFRLPLSQGVPSVEAKLASDTEGRKVSANVVSPEFFATFGIPLLTGRDFDERDRVDAPGAVIVNQAAVAELWGGRDPIGSQIEVLRSRPSGSEGSFEVVGVSADSRFANATDPIEPLFYFSAQQTFRRRMTLALRSEATLAKPLAELLHGRYPEAAIVSFVPFSEQIRHALANQRLNAHLGTSFGVLGGLLAALGIFSVLSYSVDRRRREIGIRMALGASAGDVRRWVVGGALRLVAAGLVFGLIVALAAGRLLEAMLFGVSPGDLTTLLAVAGLLAAVAFCAAAWPARRAARVDPMRALREE